MNQMQTVFKKRNLPASDAFWRILWIVSLGIFFTALYVFVFKTYAAERAQRKEEIAKREEKIQSLRKVLNEEEILSDFFKTVKDDTLDRVEAALPRENQIPSLLLELTSLAKFSGFEIRSVHFQESPATRKKSTLALEDLFFGAIQPLKIELTLGGVQGYEDFKNLLHSFEESLRIFEVKQFHYNPKDDEYDFSLESYWLQTPPEDSSKIWEQIKNTKDIKSLFAFFLQDESFARLRSFKDPLFLSQSKEVFVKGENPSSPSQVVLYDPGYGQTLILSWQAFESETSRVHIFRSSSPLEKGDEIINLPSYQGYYVDINLVNRHPYYYTLAIENEFGQTNFSNTVLFGTPTDRIPPRLPGEVKIESVKEGEVALYWKNPLDSDFQYVNIYRSIEKNKKGDLIASHVTEETFTDSIKNKPVLYYSLSTVDGSGNESPIVPVESFIKKRVPFEINK